MNDSVKIISAVVIFFVFAVSGYFIMSSNSPKSVGIDITQTGGGVSTGGTPAGPKVPGPDGETETPQTDQKDSESTTESKPTEIEPEEQPITPPLPEEPVKSAETTPEIKSVDVEQRDSKNYKKIGLAFTAKAVVASGDKLRYELYEIGETTAKYTSDNGSFKEVYPVDGGKYLLKVVNTKTGDFAERQVSGFNKIDKYTPAKLQEQLNSETTERLFYFHFDLANLKFDCEGIDSSEVPTSLNALALLSGDGWILTVVGTPQYDTYNRITYFKVRANR